jgi:hypothetical protein
LSRSDGRSAACRPFLILTTALGLSGCLLAGCADLAASDVSDAHTEGASSAPAQSGRDPGCVAALKAISKYGPSSVKLLAQGREAVNHAGVQLLVTALDGAADAAGQAAIRSDIKTLADAYEGYFRLTTDVAAVPLSALLKDTVDLEGLCRG